MLDADEARMLAEVGMLAAGAGDVARADRVFLALRRLRPGRAYPYLGLALARANAGRAEEAAALLERAQLEDESERSTLQAWHGLMLQLAGRHAQSRQLLARLAAGQGEGAALARALLGMPSLDCPPAGFPAERPAGQALSRS